MTQYTQFACPNTSCSLHSRFDTGNITHRSWTGKNKDIERLRCTACLCEFSARRATLLENSKISLKTHEQMMKCMRWGVCDEGIADICDVSIKTVRLNQQKAASHAVKLHDTRVQEVKEAGVQCDEVHCKIAGDKGFWAGTAIGMESLMIIAVAFGRRNQVMADRLLAEVFLRITVLLSIFTDGWRPYLTAVIKGFGRLYQPKRKHPHRRLPQKRIQLPDIFYGQVVKIRDATLKLLGVEHRALIGKMKEIVYFINAYGIGNKIHTSHVERWYGSLRTCVACCRRRSRCLSKLRGRQKQKIWIYISLYNWVLPHSSLIYEGNKRTPAMAAGMSSRILTYQEYITTPVFDNYAFREKLAEKMSKMNSQEMLGASQRVKIKPEKLQVMQTGKVAA